MLLHWLDDSLQTVETISWIHFQTFHFYDGHDGHQKHMTKNVPEKTPSDTPQWTIHQWCESDFIGFHYFHDIIRPMKGNATFRSYAAHESLYYRLRLIISFFSLSLSFVCLFFFHCRFFICSIRLILSYMWNASESRICLFYSWFLSFSVPLFLLFAFAEHVRDGNDKIHQQEKRIWQTVTSSDTIALFRVIC